MLDGASPEPLLYLVFSQLLDIGECFRFVHIDKNIFKVNSNDEICNTLPYKRDLLNLLFDNCLLVEISHYFYTICVVV